MEINQCIKQRHSTRNYSPKKVDDDLIKKILEAAYAAPVAKAKYNDFKIVMLTNTKIIDQFNSILAKSPSEHGPFYNAPILITIIKKVIERERLDGQSAGCIIENMMLAAESISLGTCFVDGPVNNANENQEIRAKLQMKKEEKIIGFMLLGYEANNNVLIKNRPGIETVIID